MGPLAKLGFNGPVFIAQLVNFGLLLVLLRLFAYKPIMKMLDTRANKIKESLEAGDRAKQEAVSAEKEIAKKIEEASASGQQIVGQAVKTAEEVKRRASLDAKKEADAIVAKAQVEIQREKQESMTELRKEVADLAVMVAGKAIGTSIDKETQRKLIENTLKEVSSLK
ncbi:MAG TPA: F0F1 ATP synthase subunit B [Sedimentisphaerales bacterium]|jgi:F-type H+-transporting ATPase subunit b